jgi:N-methylhydantoinase A/oxoprolinase/acetone carboxylase beta subunit
MWKNIAIVLLALVVIGCGLFYYLDNQKKDRISRAAAEFLEKHYKSREVTTGDRKVTIDGIEVTFREGEETPTFRVRNRQPVSKPPTLTKEEVRKLLEDFYAKYDKEKPASTTSPPAAKK